MAPEAPPSGRGSRTFALPPRPSSKLVRDGSVRPGQDASASVAARPVMRCVSTTNAAYPMPDPPAISVVASPLYRATIRNRVQSSNAIKRYSLPTALSSPQSPFSSSLDEFSSSELGDGVESSFWTSQHPLSSCAEPPEESPSESPTAEDDLDTEVFDLDTDVCSLLELYNKPNRT